jgi:hypothetical protein
LGICVCPDRYGLRFLSGSAYAYQWIRAIPGRLAEEILASFAHYRPSLQVFNPPRVINSPMRFFIAGIMQGSHTVNHMHNQEYRQRIAQLLEEHFPDAEIYDPLAKHKRSLDYDKLTGREVFFRHNAMCREVDVLLAFVPEASMGTAIEMWEAHQHGAAILTISPMKHNWTIKFLSHGLYDDEDGFIAALRNGEVATKIEGVLGTKRE